MTEDPQVHLIAMDLVARIRDNFASVNKLAHDASAEFGQEADEIDEQITEIQNEITDEEDLNPARAMDYVVRLKALDERVRSLFSRMIAELRSKTAV